MSTRVALKRRAGARLHVMFSVWLASSTLVGCSSFQLHSDTRQKQAETAEAAWKDVDLKPIFAQERDHQAKLEAAEIASWSASADREHEKEVRTLAALPLSQYSNQFDETLKRATGIPTGAEVHGHPQQVKDRDNNINSLRAARAATITLNAAQKALKYNLSYLLGVGAPEFSCPQLTATGDKTIVKDWRDKHPKESTVYAAMFDEAAQNCRDIDNSRSRYTDSIQSLPPSSPLRVEQERAKKDREAIEKKQADIDAKTLALKADQTELDQAIAAAKGDPTAESIKTKAAKVQKTIDDIVKTCGALGVQVVAKERLDRIDELLGSLAKGDAIDADNSSKLDQAIAVMPQVIEDEKAISLASKQRAIAPLLLQRDLEKANLSASSAVVARMKKDVAFSEAILLAKVKQANYYADAVEKVNESFATKGVKETGAGELPISDALPKLPNEGKHQIGQNVVLASMQYLDAFTRQKKDIKALEIQRQDLVYEGSVDTAESNAGIWQTLIGTTVSQSSEYAKLGFDVSKDAKDIAALISLIYIGHGTNKK